MQHPPAEGVEGGEQPPEDLLSFQVKPARRVALSRGRAGGRAGRRVLAADPVIGLVRSLGELAAAGNHPLLDFIRLLGQRLAPWLTDSLFGRTRAAP